MTKRLMSLKYCCLRKTEFLLPRLRTVSYTHLDVYKRQATCSSRTLMKERNFLDSFGMLFLNKENFELYSKMPISIHPVSYTHLDVYKRQFAYSLDSIVDKPPFSLHMVLQYIVYDKMSYTPHDGVSCS